MSCEFAKAEQSESYWQHCENAYRLLAEPSNRFENAEYEKYVRSLEVDSRPFHPIQMPPPHLDDDDDEYDRFEKFVNELPTHPLRLEVAQSLKQINQTIYSVSTPGSPQTDLMAHINAQLSYIPEKWVYLDATKDPTVIAGQLRKNNKMLGKYRKLIDELLGEYSKALSHMKESVSIFNTRENTKPLRFSEIRPIILCISRRPIEIVSNKGSGNEHDEQLALVYRLLRDDLKLFNRLCETNDTLAIATNAIAASAYNLRYEQLLLKRQNEPSNVIRKDADLYRLTQTDIGKEDLQHFKNAIESLSKESNVTRLAENSGKYKASLDAFILRFNYYLAKQYELTPEQSAAIAMPLYLTIRSRHDTCSSKDVLMLFRGIPIDAELSRSGNEISPPKPTSPRLLSSFQGLLATYQKFAEMTDERSKKFFEMPEDEAAAFDTAIKDLEDKAYGVKKGVNPREIDVSF
ncbi:hypothetical protein [uncultured Rubinisphaera sp.]|uniref:hypothetical protein n=1 Tax=uncultured Rubinisphaera sp. TaxID=1678686 RepID=UPI0030D88D3A